MRIAHAYCACALNWNGTWTRVYRMADSIGEGSSSINKGSSSSTRSVFDSLKAQALSDLTRKRSVHCNPPPNGKHRARGEGSSEPKTITASQRVKEFPD